MVTITKSFGSEVNISVRNKIFIAVGVLARINLYSFNYISGQSVPYTIVPGRNIYHPRMRVGNVFGHVCVSVCVSVCSGYNF